MIALACDHGGFAYKQTIMKYLDKEGYAYKDFGTFSEESCDYPDFALAAAESVAKGECDRGILVCGTGIGISIAANKVPGVRAAHCHDVFSAKATRLHNDANMLAMGERVIGEGLMLEIVEAFLNTPFSGEMRHKKRIEKIAGIERKYCK